MTIVTVAAYSVVQVDTVTRINAFWNPERSTAPTWLSCAVVVIGGWTRVAWGVECGVNWAVG